MIAVLFLGRHPNASDLAGGERGLEHPTSVATDDGLDIVDEQNKVAVGLAHLVEAGAQPVVEDAADLRPGAHGGQVEGEDGPARDRLGDVAERDALGQPLDDRRLADAGLADQHRVVLDAAREDLHDPADFSVPPDNRVQGPIEGQVGEAAAELPQVARPFWAVRSGAAQGRDGALQLLRCDPGGREALPHSRAGALVEDRFEQVERLDLRRLPGPGQTPCGLRRPLQGRGRRANPTSARLPPWPPAQGFRDNVDVDPVARQDRPKARGVVPEHGQEHMLRLHLGLAAGDRHVVGGAKVLLCACTEPIEVHRDPLIPSVLQKEVYPSPSRGVTRRRL